MPLTTLADRWSRRVGPSDTDPSKQALRGRPACRGSGGVGPLASPSFDKERLDTSSGGDIGTPGLPDT